MPVDTSPILPANFFLTTSASSTLAPTQTATVQTATASSIATAQPSNTK